ncbi:MAG: hypothetical protein Q9170_007433 [Blastenia crenularia]
MAEYHEFLQELEELVQALIELVGRGSRNAAGIEKGINYKLAGLRHESSLPSKAEEYCRRLKIVRQQLGGYAMPDMDRLISQQEKLLPEARPNVSKICQPRSPKLSPPSPPVVRQQQRPRNTVHTTADPHAAWNFPQPTNVGPRNLTHAPASQAAPAPSIPGAWHVSNYQPLQPHSTTHHVEPVPPHDPPAHYMTVLSIHSRGFRYRNKNRYQSVRIKIGGVHNHADNYSGFTHWLLSGPGKIGAVLWSPSSPFVIVHSSDYVPKTAGDALHIRANGIGDAAAFVGYLRQWCAHGSMQIYQVSTSVEVFFDVSMANCYAARI